jgi:hypothetical protein
MAFLAAAIPEILEGLSTAASVIGGAKSGYDTIKGLVDEYFPSAEKKASQSVRLVNGRARWSGLPVNSAVNNELIKNLDLNTNKIQNSLPLQKTLPLTPINPIVRNLEGVISREFRDQNVDREPVVGVEIYKNTQIPSNKYQIGGNPAFGTIGFTNTTRQKRKDLPFGFYDFIK